MDIRAASTVDAPPPLGKVKLEIKGAEVVITITKNDQPLSEGTLDKVTKERLSLVRKKAKLLQDRLNSLKKKQGFEDASFKLKEKEPTQIELVASESVLEGAKEEDEVVDMNRSLMKFNSRSALLVLQLQGNLTLAECISALFNSIKEELKKRGKAIKLAIEDGIPKIEGIPENPEDFLPELVASAWELFKGLVDFLKELKEKIPALEPEFQDIINEGKELPNNLKSAAESANLSAMETLKAGKCTTGNIKELGTAPSIIKALGSTVQDTLLEIAGAITKLKDAN